MLAICFNLPLNLDINCRKEQPKALLRNLILVNINVLLIFTTDRIIKYQFI